MVADLPSTHYMMDKQQRLGQSRPNSALETVKMAALRDHSTPSSTCFSTDIEARAMFTGLRVP